MEYTLLNNIWKYKINMTYFDVLGLKDQTWALTAVNDKIGLINLKSKDVLV